MLFSNVSNQQAFYSIFFRFTFFLLIPTILSIIISQYFNYYRSLLIENIDLHTKIVYQAEHFSAPFISVVVPTYQEEKILELCLKVFTQKRKEKFHIELIISDGGSTDATVEISKQYADTIIQYTGSEKQGIAKGRNEGADSARGEILIFLNGDTIIQDPDDFFEFISSWGKGNLQASSAPALACRVDVFPEEKIWKDKIFYSIHNRYVQMLNIIGMGMGRGECQIIKRSAFDAVGGYKAHLMAGEDFELYTRLAKIGKIHFENSIVALESPRRFRKQGYLLTLGAWTVNALSVMFFNKSFSDEWSDIR